MKPIHIVVLVVAGVIAGAVGMNIMQKSHRNAQAPAVAQVAQPPAPVDPQTPAAQPAPNAAPVEPAPVEPAKPSPMLASKAGRAQAARNTRSANPEPVAIAQAEPPAATPISPTPSPEPASPAPVASPARPEPEPIPAPAPPPPPRQVTLNAGTTIPVRLIDGLSTERNHAGDVFTATMDKELVVDGFVIAERGARVDGRVVSSDPGGKVQGVAGLAVELTRLRTSDGQTVSIQTDSFARHAEQTKRQDAEKVGAGAAIGAVIGAIAGGGKGAAIGAGVGGGAGAGGVLLTRGKPATLPSETQITFRLSTPVTITERR